MHLKSRGYFSDALKKWWFFEPDTRKFPTSKMALILLGQDASTFRSPLKTQKWHEMTRKCGFATVLPFLLLFEHRQS